ncbi:MAG: CPBP family intramembrane metalloprotease [Prevotella sp.]|jgi:membrane protease YdiL (CAAX protease family)|nr:CPBP family intramembrane metalloprotease [Prevotella sp.]
MTDSNKNFLHDMEGWSQFFFFFFLSISGLMFTIVALQLCVDITQLDQSPKIMRMALTLQSVCAFLVPSLAFAYLTQNSTKQYLKTEHYQNILFLSLSILLIIVIQPMIDCIAHYNQQLTLPESMSALEKWIQEGELSAEKTTNLLFGDKTITGLIFNLLVIALVAGLAEEFFFRGCVQQIMQKIVKNKHAAVWISAVIFSAIHFQFYGFVPRVLLGAVLGYLFVWAGNIWVPVIVHTVNNTIGVILSFIYYGSPQYENIENFNFEQNLEIVIISSILSILLLIFIYRRRKSAKISD